MVLYTAGSNLVFHMFALRSRFIVLSGYFIITHLFDILLEKTATTIEICEIKLIYRIRSNTDCRV